MNLVIKAGPENVPVTLPTRQESPRVSGVWPAVLTSMLAAALLVGAAQAETRYKIIHLPTPDGYNSTALGLNDTGKVVGYSYQGDNSNAFLYKYSDGSTTDLGSLGGQATVATAINQSDQIVGYSSDGNGNVLAFLYDQGISSLSALKDASNSEAFAINIAGKAVGDSQADGDSHRPVLFAKDEIRDLGISTKNSDTLKTAYGINAGGQIVGRYDTENGTVHGFLFFDDRLTDLGTLGGENSEALGINVNGAIVGDSETSDGVTHAFVFRNGSMQDLGTLPSFNKASFARAINNHGQIVGDSDSENQKRAFVYTDGEMINLTRAAINMREAGFSALDVADGINHKGWIVGFGTTLDGRLAAFLAIPVGVTADPPGGNNAPEADSGNIGGFVQAGGTGEALIGGGIGGGWFFPPALWRPGWHYHFIWRRPPHWRDHDHDHDHDHTHDHDKDHDHDHTHDHDKDHDKDHDHNKDHDHTHDHDKDHDHNKDHDHDKDHDHNKDPDHGPKGHGNEPPRRLEPQHHEHEGKPEGHHGPGRPEEHHGENRPEQHSRGGGKPPEHHGDNKPEEHPKGKGKKKK